MTAQHFGSIWDAIEDTAEEAQNMKVRSQLMAQLKSYVSESGLSQSDAAKILGVTQPRISDLMRGKINLFAIDALINMAASAGLRVEMQLVDAA